MCCKNSWLYRKVLKKCYTMGIISHMLCHCSLGTYFLVSNLSPLPHHCHSKTASIKSLVASFHPVLHGHIVTHVEHR